MKLIKLHIFLLSIGPAIFFLSCSPQDSSTATNTEKQIIDNTTDGPNTPPEGSEPVEVSKTKPLQSKDLLYAWVDKLNIRDQPTTKGKTVSAVQSKDALVYTGEKSEQTETIVLRGVAYDEPWLKVIAPDKTEGWVFGGAVKGKDEEKGNAILDETHFDFPYFGNFDLSKWKKISSKDESGGDADITTVSYQKGSQYLEIMISDVGEYGYSRTYKLMDANKTISKERTLNFISDMDFKELTEIVKDFTSNPPKQYQRKQKMKIHFMQMNAKPMMVNGSWTESTLNADTPSTN